MASLDLFCCGLVPCTTVASCVCGSSEEVAVADWDQDIGKGAEPSALWDHAPARTPKETAPRANQKKPVVLLLESVTRNEALGFQVWSVSGVLASQCTNMLVSHPSRTKHACVHR